MNLADAFSVGVGYRERYDHRQAIRRQIETKNERDRGEGESRGPVAGIRLSSGHLTVSREIGRAIYEDRTLRLRLRCGIGDCAERIDGPIRDPRSHYLHSRAHDINEILRRPEPWRPMLQRDRLVLALDLRAALSQHFQ